MHNVMFPMLLMFGLFTMFHMITRLASKTMGKTYFETFQSLRLINIMFDFCEQAYLSSIKSWNLKTNPYRFMVEFSHLFNHQF